MRNDTLARRIAAAAFVGLLATGHAVAGGSPFGVEATTPADACLVEGPAHDEPLAVLVVVDPEALRDPAWLEALLACAPDHHLEIVIRLEPPIDWQLSPDPYAALRGWLADLDRFLHEHRGRLGHFELGHHPDRVFTPRAYAYLVESVATLLHAADPSFDLTIGSLGDSSSEWLAALDPGRLAPYIRGLALENPEDPAAAAARLRRIHPGLSLWLHLPPKGSDAASFLRGLHEARAAGFQKVFAAAGESLELIAILVNLARALPSRFEVDPQPPLDDPSLLPYADPLSPERAVIAPAGLARPIGEGLVTMAQVRAVDLLSGADLPAGDGTIAPAGPILLRFVLIREPRSEPETIGVTGERGLTAGEIIARNRAFEAVQARALSHYQAKATISYHYRAETLGESIDVASVNRFFWKDAVGEYEETDLYVNGARWRGKPPSLPFVAAEKVKEVPLEIRLDQAYRYTLRGEDRTNGRAAYVIAFAPVSTDRALYSGEAWIDKESFARLKVRFLQHGLSEPITSSEDTIEYGPIDAAAGPGAGASPSLWLPVRAYRQMVFTVLGRSVAVERRVAWEDFSINSPAFEPEREQAYDSGRPVLRDDEAGYSYLVKEGDVIRTRPAESLRNVALFGGLSLNSDLSLGTPFVGLNYFDFNWRGTGTQLDVAFAGALLDVVWTDPALGKSRWELSVEGRGVAMPDSFKKVSDSGRETEEDLRVLEERLYLTVGRRLGSYQKVELGTELAYDNYDRRDTTDPDFKLPPTRPAVTLSPRWRYLRSGYSLDLWFSQGRRFGWGDWGLQPDPDPNAVVPANPRPEGGSGDDLSFQRWGVGLLKSFYSSRMQKLSVGGGLMAGRDLDRFSRYRIGEFRNARVRGYNGYDVSFDRGATLQLTYKTTLPRGGVSLDVEFQRAVIENDEDFRKREYLAGGGVGISFTGPWSTLMTVRSGFPLGSSIDVGHGGASFRLVMIRTWDHWPFHRRVKKDEINPSSASGT
ncbi:MAG TPA: hypothetical protein VGK94_09970 [Candidatus Polarisedimenticolia bacterium]